VTRSSAFSTSLSNSSAAASYVASDGEAVGLLNNILKLF
jgi:hypothetical protein